MENSNSSTVARRAPGVPEARGVRARPKAGRWRPIEILAGDGHDAVVKPRRIRRRRRKAKRWAQLSSSRSSESGFAGVTIDKCIHTHIILVFMLIISIMLSPKPLGTTGAGFHAPCPRTSAARSSGSCASVVRIHRYVPLRTVTYRHIGAKARRDIRHVLCRAERATPHYAVRLSAVRTYPTDPARGDT